MDPREHANATMKSKSAVPGVGRRDHGDPVGGVGLEDAGDGDLEERLVGDRRPGPGPGPGPAGDADIDGQVGARVEARVELLPVHRPELRLARVALVHRRRRLRRRQRRGGRRARDGGGAVQADEREQHGEQRGAAGAGALLEETHRDRLRPAGRACGGRVGVASSCGRAPRAKKHGVPGAAGRRKVICRARTAPAAPSRLCSSWPVWTAISKTSRWTHLAAGAEAHTQRSMRTRWERAELPIPLLVPPGVAIAISHHSPESRAYIYTNQVTPASYALCSPSDGERHKW